MRAMCGGSGMDQRRRGGGGLGLTYEGTNSAACSDGRDGSGAHVASDAATGGQCGEDEGDVVERLRKLVLAGIVMGRCWKLEVVGRMILQEWTRIPL